MVDVSENVLDVLSPRLAKSKITPYENNLIIDEKIHVWQRLLCIIWQQFVDYRINSEIDYGDC